MPPNTVDWVAASAAVMAVGTAILAVLTVFLVRSRARLDDTHRWQEAQRALLHERARTIRHNLQRAVAYSDDLSRQLCSLRPLISGASNIADQIYYRLGPNVTAAKVQTGLADDAGLAATVCTAGWNTSLQTRAMDGVRADLRLAGLALDGQLTLVTRAIELYDDMIDAGCSPAVFEDVLGNKPFMRLFFEEHSSQSESQMLVNSLTSALQVEATSYFNNHMRLSVEYLNDFIKIAGNEFIGWSDEKLVAAAARENPAALDSSTKVNYIQAILKDLRPEIHGTQIFEVMELLVGFIDAFSATRRNRT